jgi:hypothetical protein
LKLPTIKSAIRKTAKIIRENCLGTRSLGQKAQKGTGKTEKGTESGSSHLLWVFTGFRIDCPLIIRVTKPGLSERLISVNKKQTAVSLECFRIELARFSRFSRVLSRKTEFSTDYQLYQMGY